MSFSEPLAVNTDARAPFRVLLAEDEIEMRSLLAWTLRRSGYQVTECRDGDELMRWFDPFDPDGLSHRTDLIITDIKMPGSSGLCLLERLGTREDLPPVILITAFADSHTFEQAEALGAVALVSKPFDVDDLLAEVEQVALLDFVQGTRQRLAPVPRESGHTLFPLDIAFRDLNEVGPIRAFICEVAGKLNRFSERISGCRVAVEKCRNRYRVHIDINVPHKTLVVSCNGETKNGVEDAYSAIRTAFSKAARRLEEDKQRRG